MKKYTNGFSLIEVILAVGLFVIIVSGSVGTVLQGFGLNRLSDEQTIATQFASEGLEAAQSIRNQEFYNLTDTSGTGLTQSVGVWIFSGTNNQFGPNNKFTRTIIIDPVYRDLVSDQITTSSGYLDINTKKITSNVTWNYSPQINDSVILSSYLTNFKEIMGVSPLIYGVGSTTPQYRLYDQDTNSFSAETPTIVGASPLTLALKTSPTKTETIAAYVTSGGTLQVMCFNGTTWSNEWSANVGGTGTTRRFNIAYEKNSGDVMVLYGTNTGATNELAYRTKPGTTRCGAANWSSVANFDPIRTSGVVHWVKMASDRRKNSNLIAAIWADANSDLSAAIWDGNTWVNEPTSALETSLENVSFSQDVDDFDVEYESLSGDLMVVWADSTGANGTNGVRYRTCTGGVSLCSWSGELTPPTFSDGADNLDLAANFNTDEMVFASIGAAGGDLQAGYWSGSAWTNQANLDTTSDTPDSGANRVAVGWLSNESTHRSIIVYDDLNGTQSDLSWVVGNGGTFTIQADFDATPPFDNDQGTLVIEMNPYDHSQLLVGIADEDNDLYIKRLIMTTTPTFTWTNADGGAALETGLPNNTTYPFAFNFNRYP